jgi:hypothetical protein
MIKQYFVMKRNKEKKRREKISLFMCVCVYIGVLKYVVPYSYEIEKIQVITGPMAILSLFLVYL